MAEMGNVNEEHGSGEPRRAERRTRKQRIGTVVSDKMDKTVVVALQRRVQHPVYGKIIRRSSKLHAHDEKNQCNVGDQVTVIECRPLSRTKTWMLKSIDERAREV
jgi:small subunit ribosomal protein S17